MYSSKIAGVGHYVPDRIITNDYLSTIMDTNDAWITERTGIKERRYFQLGTDTVANMAMRAATMALQRANCPKEAVDFIVFATITPDYYFPGCGVLLQRDMGLGHIGALDIRNQCSGFVYALSVADQFIKTGMYQNILVVGAEIQSSAIDFSDAGRGVAVIFGDGAGAVLLQRATEPGQGIVSTHLHADGNFAEELCIKDPGSSREHRRLENVDSIAGFEAYMNGNQVFKHAVVRFPEVIAEAAEANGYATSDIDLLIPHQANFRITQYVTEKMGLAPERVVSNIHKYGNTTAASIPIAMSEASAEGRINEGDLVCLAAFGSGFAWGSALIRW